MQRYIIAVVVGVVGCIVAASARAGQCPVTDVQAAVTQACPCDSFTSHGKYLACVRKEANSLRKQGCNVSRTARCATTSICGKPRSPVVCRLSNGHAKMISSARCAAKNGTAVPGATSLCDAHKG